MQEILVWAHGLCFNAALSIHRGNWNPTKEISNLNITQVDSYSQRNPLPLTKAIANPVMEAILRISDYRFLHTAPLVFNAESFPVQNILPYGVGETVHTGFC